MTLLKDLEGEVIKLATFLGKTLSEKELDQLVNHLSFGSFEKNGAVNMEIFKEIDYMNKNAGNFIRKGMWKIGKKNQTEFKVILNDSSYMKGLLVTGRTILVQNLMKKLINGLQRI